MITAHLTDAEIQLYIADPEMISDQQKIHIQGCTNCQAKVANYRLLFSAIHDHVKPRFDFDLSALVMEQLPEPKRAFPWAALLIPMCFVSFIALLSVCFWSYIKTAITGASMVLIATAVTAAAFILIFQVVEMIKSHKKQLNAILNVKTLQL